MKKILIFTLVPMALLLGSIIFTIAVSYSYVQYENNTYFHVMGSMEEQNATAEFDGQETILSRGNLRKISSLLTPADLKRKFFGRRLDEDGGIVLSFPDGAKYVVIRDEESEDGVYIEYSIKRKKLLFWVEGYKTYDWLIRVISPEGMYGENELGVQD